MGDDPFFRTGAQARPPRNSTTLRPSASRAIFPAPIRTDTGFGTPRCSFCLDLLAAQHSIQTMPSLWPVVQDTLPGDPIVPVTLGVGIRLEQIENQ